MDYQEAIQDLIKGTNFELSIKSQVLTSCTLKVRTPIEALNCLLGGGLPLSGIYHTWGPPKAGKSTWLYQTMGLFQQQYPDGVCIIIDMESSADPNRLRAFGIDVNKVVRLPATSVESGFIALLKILNNKQNNDNLREVPVFVIWDTISRGMAQDDSSQSRMNARDRARIIKNYMPTVSAEIEKQPFILGLINQVINATDMYGNTHQEAGGGIALQHDNHLSLKIERMKAETYDSTNSFITEKWSKLSVDKSKLSPEIKNIPFLISIPKGGYIEERPSFVWYCIDNMHFVDENRGWYNFDTLCQKYQGTKIGDYLLPYNKKYRYNDVMRTLCEDQILYDILRCEFINYTSDIFKLQANIMEPYRQEIMEEIISVVGSDDSVVFVDSTEEGEGINE